MVAAAVAASTARGVGSGTNHCPRETGTHLRHRPRLCLWAGSRRRKLCPRDKLFPKLGESSPESSPLVPLNQRLPPTKSEYKLPILRDGYPRITRSGWRSTLNEKVNACRTYRSR